MAKSYLDAGRASSAGRSLPLGRSLSTLIDNPSTLEMSMRAETVLTISLALCALVGPSSLNAQGALAPVEQTIVERVDANNDEALALLERIVNINSGSMNFEGVREVGSVFLAELDALGFETNWVDGTPFQRSGHVVATRTGSGPHLLLIGHLDTVFEADSPFQRWEEIDDSTAKGPGIADMKGGDVIIVYALRALEEAGLLSDMSITVIMTGDEEKVGSPIDLARQALIDAAREADIAVAFENGDGNPRTAVVARRGSTSWRLEVSGYRAHSSQVFQPEVGAGAIYEAARILTGFYDQLSSVPNLTFNPGVILGGTDLDFDGDMGRGEAFGKNNVTAQTAVVSGDLRAISIEQREEAKARMRDIVADHLPVTEATITFSDGYPPLAPSDGNYRLLALYDQVSQDLGFGAVEAVNPRNAGAADVSFTAGLVDMAIDGIGMMGANDHSPDETGDLGSLSSQTKRAAVLLYRLTNRGATD
jgi:glutamate carboxypeptidase